MSNISSCKKKLFEFSCGCKKFHLGRSFGFLVINVCNHGEHYETPCIRQHVSLGTATHLLIYMPVGMTEYVTNKYKVVQI